MTVDRRQIVAQCPVRDSHQQRQNKKGGLLDWQQAFVFCPWKDCKPPPIGSAAWATDARFGLSLKSASKLGHSNLMHRTNFFLMWSTAEPGYGQN